MSLIKNHFEISQYKTDSWVLETATGHFYISDLSKQLLDILKNSRSVQEAATAFNNTFNFNLNEKKMNYIEVKKDKVKVLTG